MSHFPDVADAGVGADLRPAPGAEPSAASAAAGVAQAVAWSEKAAAARFAGDEAGAERCFRAAVALMLRVLEDDPAGPGSGHALRAARWALECGEVATARQLWAARREPVEESLAAGWAEIGEIDTWPDAWLVAAVRRSPPDEAALDALAQRYWKSLFGRCQLLAVKHEAAADLAQDTWCRVLRGRERLRPGGNFRAYLFLIATNLWRDSQRASLRAGALAESRLSSLDGEIALGEGGSVSLAEVLPDLDRLEAEQRDRLKLDLDHALARLEALWRDVLVARFLDGESCAEIGRRYGRTEQTVSGWVRRAVLEMKRSLDDSRRGTPEIPSP